MATIYEVVNYHHNVTENSRFVLAGSPRKEVVGIWYRGSKKTVLEKINKKSHLNVKLKEGQF